MNGWIFTIGRRQKRTLLERLFALFVVCSMTGFHLVPLVALAEEPEGEEDRAEQQEEKQDEEEGSKPKEEESEEEGESEQEEKGVEQKGDEEEGEEKEKEEEAVANSGKSPSESAEPKEAKQDPEKDNTEADIVNENEADLEVEVVAESDTGGNEIEADEADDEVFDTDVADETFDTDEAEEGEGCENPEASDSQEADGSDSEEEAYDTEISTDGGESNVKEDPEATIDTGDALADGVSIVDVNTNIVGEDIEKEVVNISGESDEDVNVFEDFLEIVEEPESDENNASGEENPSDEEEAAESLDVDEAMESEGLSVENGNVASIKNTVSADTASGDNTIEGADGDATIETGDATAIATAINIANVNLVGEDGLFAVINNFGEWAGDIVLPGYGLLSLLTDGSRYRIVENDNELILVETVSADADSGGNAIEGVDGDASIESGNAAAIAGSETLANINIVGDAWLTFFFNNFGTWTGMVIDGDEVIGDSVSYSLGGDGEVPDEEEEEEEEREACPEPGCADIASVSNRNIAFIENTVSASASTGSNTIEGADGDTTIETGDATAIANVFNLANINIVGSNWLFGVFNNFGAWTGNLVFAYPDLAVTIDDGWDSVYPESDLTYEVSVTNVGRAEAKGVSFSLDLPTGFETSDSISDIPGSLAPGESFSFSVSGVVKGESTGSTLVAIATASTETREKHEENNRAMDETEVMVPEARITRISDDDEDDEDADLSVRRETVGSSSVYPTGEIVHRIMVMNDGEVPLYDVIVDDRFYDPARVNFDTYVWDIGYLGEDEGVIIEYSFWSVPTAPVGDYEAVARAVARDGDDDTVKSGRSKAAFTILRPAYAEETEEESVEPDLIATAEAAPETLGAFEDAERGLPIWMLLLSGLAYALVMNWAFIPKVSTYDKD